MSVGLSIKVTDTATQAVREKAQALGQDKLAAAVAPAIGTQVKNHLLANGKNKKGWPSTHFWAGAARSTLVDKTDEGVVVSINQIGVRQRYFGGEIKPVRARALAIPMDPISYGHVPSDFPGLFMMKTDKGSFLVQAGQQISAKGNFVKRDKSAGGNASKRIKRELDFLFQLAPSVMQAAEPRVLPEDSALTKTAVKAIEEAAL